MAFMQYILYWWGKRNFRVGSDSKRLGLWSAKDIISPTARLHPKIFHTIDAKFYPTFFFLSYLLRCISFYSCNISMKNWSVPIVLSSSDSLCWHLHLPLLLEPTVPDRWHNWRLCFCYPHRQRVVWRRQMQFCFSSSSVFLPEVSLSVLQSFTCAIPIEYQLYTRNLCSSPWFNSLTGPFLCGSGGGGGCEILRDNQWTSQIQWLRFCLPMQGCSFDP